MRESSKDCVVGEHHVVLLRRVVHIVECKLHVYLIAAHEAVRSDAHHRLRVNVERRHRLGDRLTEPSRAIPESELALHCVRVGDVREQITLKEDLRATLIRSRGGLKSIQSWLGIIAEEEARVNPVDSIQRDFDRKSSCNVIIRRRVADNANSREVSGASDLITDHAVWDHAIVKLLIEPSSRNLDGSTTVGQALSWLNLYNDWLVVVVVRNRRLCE